VANGSNGKRIIGSPYGVDDGAASPQWR
jgi:hypothetical protein